MDLGIWFFGENVSVEQTTRSVEANGKQFSELHVSSMKQATSRFSIDDQRNDPSKILRVGRVVCDAGDRFQRLKFLLAHGIRVQHGIIISGSRVTQYCCVNHSVTQGTQKTLDVLKGNAFFVHPLYGGGDESLSFLGKEEDRCPPHKRKLKFPKQLHFFFFSGKKKTPKRDVLFSETPPECVCPKCSLPKVSWCVDILQIKRKRKRDARATGVSRC
mmetsp:Transcript_30531/g.79168  ORF Transcript_30531/g.79168 Transcript_30531/m.79168 type:complete len:216 (-) Transcript_30531:666-1313(-)